MSGFRRAGSSKVPFIEGTKASIRNNQLILSTGCSGLDALLGDGFPLGQILLIEEDEFDTYAPILAKYFLAEGVVNSHDVFFADTSEDPAKFLEELPSPINFDASSNDPTFQTDEDQMKIAFRYESLPKINSGVEQRNSMGISAHNFDLGQNINDLSKSALKQIFSPISSAEKPPLEALFLQLKSLIKDSPYDANFDSKKNILRIAIRGIGSPLWGSEEDIPRFLWLLKSLLRQSYATCLISVSECILKPEIRWRFRRICDAGFRMEAFFGSDKETNSLFSDYHGLLHILQLPKAGVVQCFIPDCFDLAFKLRRKKFCIEKLHLPPELSSSEHTDNKFSIGGCATNFSGSKLDF